MGQQIIPQLIFYKHFIIQAIVNTQPLLLYVGFIVLMWPKVQNMKIVWLNLSQHVVWLNHLFMLTDSS
jgi:hypothetical protein